MRRPAGRAVRLLVLLLVHTPEGGPVSALDLWMLGIGQGETGFDLLGVMYAMDTDFWLLLGRLAESEAPAYFAAAHAKAGL